MPTHTQNVPVTVSQVYVAFQSTPMQDIPTFNAGKVTMPGVGPKTEKILLACDIKNPCALLGQFMVHFWSPVVAAVCCAFFACVCTYTLRFFLCTLVWQVLDRDKARMSVWLKEVAKVRLQEANVICAALDEKCRKILTV